MKILFYGAGVVGTTYAWQLSNAGYNVTMLVRKEKKVLYENSNFHIECYDFRNKKETTIQTVFSPNIIDELPDHHDFEYIIVTTSCIHLKNILPELATKVNHAHIVFFLNIWDDFELISKYLHPKQYFFGFPFMVGGGRTDNIIKCAISGLKYSHTPLGELDGSSTRRILKLAEALDKANLKPRISNHIKIWLITHYAIATGLSAGILRAGNADNFIQKPELIKETIKSIREGLEICLRRGINPKLLKDNKLYYLPLFISVPIARKVYANKALKIMFNGHTGHAPDEMHKMVDDIIEYGKMYNVETPYLNRFKENIFEE